MRRRIAILAVVMLAAVGVAVEGIGAISAAQRKELNAIKADVGKLTALINRKKIDDAEEALAAAESRLTDYLKTEEIPETDATLRAVRQLIEKQKGALRKAAGKAHDDEISFTDSVTPILTEKCLGCHGNEAKGGLKLDTFAGMEEGGRNKPLLVIGQPDQSLLLARLITPEVELRMPKGGDALTAEEVKTISTWIAAGAKFDGESKASKLTGLRKSKPEVDVAQATGQEKMSFVKDVAPGFVKVCGGCHNDENRSGGLSMVTFEKLMQGGDSGAVLIPGKLDDSKLWTMLTEGDMPRGQARITRKWYGDLQTWIEEGCKFDGRDSHKRLADLIPSDQEAKLAELAKLTPEELAERRLKMSDEQWTKTFPKVTAKQVSSEEFVLFGDVSEVRLQQINKWAEADAASLRKVFHASKGPLFRGKLAIFVFKDRFGYEEFNSTVHRREVPREIRGHAQVTPVTQEEAFIAVEDVSDGVSDSSPGMRLNLMQQLTGAFLRREAKGDLPDWLLQGTGLALGAKGGLGGEYLGGLRKSAGGALTGSLLEKPEQVFESGMFPPGDVDAVGLALVEYLLKQGGGMSNFQQFVKDLQSGDTVDAALKSVYHTDAKTLGSAFIATHAGGAKKKK